ncbi:MULTISPECIES: nucleoside triphosphate pyrophosphohydrolase [unclassified Aureimonas]|uniref:nucleoside triphosphate pyrophosphohydrolase n=1 Tax=unclassified Aureimonas TaxID=2615206 RepID=UPI0006F5B744|nr:MULTISPECIES: nucleoside triphosphate pyrophosphohydrolase [unclassified Aureimonas]KQT60347.1 nucleoside triphosphate hydrolase [Aureimonas sp. Leaf427]KQT79223.1 nucleoside triphosphate hydrolase [Aureimonas sp. Leaf460]
MEASRNVERLIEIMAALRDPETGCPWDIEQSFQTIAPYTVEEAYEVADAIERRDAEDLCEELGDLLLQVVYHAQLAEEAGLFAFGDVVERITTKMVRRHPHVFGDETARSARSAKDQWERIKAEEKAERAERRRLRGARDSWGGGAEPSGLLGGVSPAFPALTLALKVQQKAAKVGFDWDDASDIRRKLIEELDEFDEALAAGDTDHMEDEFGDVLFTLVNVARFHEIDAEAALRRTVAKFRQRFGHIETELQRRGSSLEAADLETMEALWIEAKTAARNDAAVQVQPAVS